MNKKEIIQSVAEASGLSNADAGRCVESLIELLSEQLAHEQPVTLPAFGKFEIKHTAARLGRNPQTGETIQIPARKAVKFKPLAALKARVAE